MIHITYKNILLISPVKANLDMHSFSLRTVQAHAAHVIP